MEARKTILPPVFWAIICLGGISQRALLAISGSEHAGEGEGGKGGLAEQQPERTGTSQSC